MGYFSLDIKKAKGTSDTTQSDHIERKIIPKNADPTRTHLNRVLVEYPDGVHGRDEAIAHRLNTAGIRRKITHDQVRVVRVVLSGTHEDMMNIQEKGELDEWCSDPDKTVEEYFIKAYNDPAIEDIYQHSVNLMVQYIRDTFGMTIEELYFLPTGE